MILIEISIETRVIIGISAMVVLYSSFLAAFITNQRKKLQYHKDLQLLNEKQQQILIEQNKLLEERVSKRTVELQEQKNALQATLADLKQSQLQLIQSEKMASLGELTAGIAHEIQNPLNFVNNFAEVNAEMLSELKEKMIDINLPQNHAKEIQQLLNDLNDNSGKILQHGKRADNIVKSMLLHSRKQSGEPEPTNLNILTDEYLKLSYHGYRAKNKSFNCILQTNFDESLMQINIVQQDIGRILINMFNNAFYSTNEKKKLLMDEYEPVISCITKYSDNKASITIRDNGMGISKKIIDKIYQPFFTTKPTGDGIGLGLSMSYDIIKANRGELKVKSVEGEYAEFIIELSY